MDEEQIARPRPWNIGEIRQFILFVGPVSSIFDYTTFFVMLWVFKCWDPSRAPLFQTGWFVESLITQTLIIHVIRTNKIPFIQSRASRALTLTTLSIMAFGIWLPYSSVASSLGFAQSAIAVLADPDPDSPRLPKPDTNSESLAAQEEMDLKADSGPRERLNADSSTRQTNHRQRSYAPRRPRPSPIIYVTMPSSAPTTVISKPLLHQD